MTIQAPLQKLRDKERILWPIILSIVVISLVVIATVIIIKVTNVTQIMFQEKIENEYGHLKSIETFNNRSIWNQVTPDGATKVGVWDGLAEVIKAVLEPIIGTIRDFIQKYLIGYVNAIVQVMLFQVFLVPVLVVIYTIFSAFRNLAMMNITGAIFGSESFSPGIIPIVFWAITISIPMILMLIILWQWVGLSLRKNADSRQILTDSAVGTLKVSLVIFLIPVGFFLVGLISSFAVQFVTLAFGVETSPTSGAFLFTDIVVNSGNAGGSEPLVFTNDNIFQRYTDLISNDLLKMVDFFATYNILLPVIMSVVLLVLLSIIALTIMIKTYEIFLLFFISPIIVGWIPMDGGAKVKILIKEIFDKSLTPVVIVFAFNVFQIGYVGVSGLINESGSWGGSQSGTQLIVQALNIIAGTFFVMNAPKILALFWGDSTGNTSAIGSAKATTSGAGKMVKGGVGYKVGVAKAVKAGATGPGGIFLAGMKGAMS